MNIRVAAAAVLLALVASGCGTSTSANTDDLSVAAGSTSAAPATTAADSPAARESAADKAAADKAAADKAAADQAAADKAAAEQSAEEQSAAEQSAAEDAETFGQYVHEWVRHTSSLTIKADKTGDMMVGSGCCNSMAFPLSYSLNSDGTLSGIVTGESTYTGTSFNDTVLPVGFEFTMSIVQNETDSYNTVSGPVLLVSNYRPYEPGDTDWVWCGDFNDARCGA